MAAGDSIVGICNIGLIALGEDPIISLSDNRKAAILCSARYDQVRRATLASHPWGCTKKQIQLASSTTAPLFTYANAYPLPADFLRMIDMPENDEAVWEVVGNVLMTDEGAPLDIIYGCDLQDPTRFEPLLVEALGFALAAVLARPLKQSSDLKQEMEGELDRRMSIARLVSSQADSPREWDEDIWLRRRR